MYWKNFTITSCTSWRCIWNGIWNVIGNHHNATNSCGAPSMIKHEGFWPCILERNLTLNGANHFIKSFCVCWEMMIHAIEIPIQCESNIIKMNRWSFTSLVPKVMSIEIALLHLSVNIDSNWTNVRIWMVNGAWISPTFVTSWKKNIILMIICLGPNGNYEVGM